MPILLGLKNSFAAYPKLRELHPTLLDLLAALDPYFFQTPGVLCAEHRAQLWISCQALLQDGEYLILKVSPLDLQPILARAPKVE